MLFYSLTDKGRKRELNEDYIYASGNKTGFFDNVFVVADGMGGHKAGDYASEHTVKVLVEAIENISDTESVPEIIKKAVSKANEYVFKCSMANPEQRGMGSTLVFTTIKNKKAYVANVGDSRLYLIRDDEIIQITKDHSYVEEMVSLGEIKREEARNHPDKNIITRAVGVKNEVEADYFEVDLQEKDKLLLCSDGLTNMLNDREIVNIINHYPLENAVKELVQSANDCGGRDNIAVVLVEPFGGC